MKTPATEMTIDWTSAGRRLDVFLSAELPELSRSRLQALVRAGDVLLNGLSVRPSQILRDGDRVTVSVPDEPIPSGILAEEIALSILHEDEDLIVLNKPAGLVVHPGAGNATGTVVNALMHHCGGLSLIGGVERPGIVHRLDKETSGCLVIAKTDAAHGALSRQFENRTVEKTYLAVVDGCPRMPHGEIVAAISRHQVHRQKMAVSERGREAITRFRVIASEGSQTLVECRPRTGRTHQIRVHLKHLGHPVIGDPLYGRRGAHTRHLLHAWRILFEHPTTGKRVSFSAPLPSDFPPWTHLAALEKPVSLRPRPNVREKRPPA